MNWLYALLTIAVILAVALLFGKGVIGYIKRLFNEIKRTDNDEN